MRFLGARRDYWRLLIRGAGLLLVTLGIYRFWLATDIRRFLWSNTEIAGETLEYTGTPIELLIGFLVAIAILVPIYASFFAAALGLGPIGQMSGAIAFVALGVLGQYAIYRARRYRLTRTIFRGLRFHQGGSAWAYALRASLWWIATALTLGLAYPFQLASLERYKMRNTYYGDLQGRFDGTGLRLLLRGLPIWLLVVVPLVLAAAGFAWKADWKALGDTISATNTFAATNTFGVDESFGAGGAMGRVKVDNAQLPVVAIFATLMGVLSTLLAFVLYPAFQAVVLRWWCDGLRFGEIVATSSLRMGSVYGAYLRFLGYSLLFSMAVGIVSGIMLAITGALVGGLHAALVAQVAVSGLMLVSYVVVALGYSVIYRATVLLSLWQLGAESLRLSGLSALDHVNASGTPSSALGEGLADALNVGGI